jgi:hypothetical protein
MACEPLYYTLRIPTALPQDIPALDISRFPDDFEPPSPDVFGDIQASVYTPAQIPVMTGPLLPRLVWAIACKLTEAESAQLAALYRWQQNRLEDHLDPALEWIDRFEPTEPEPSGQLTRDIIDPVMTTYGYVYGSPVVKCLISRPSRQLTGRSGGSNMRLCTFSVGEYRD